ncbi:MAG: molybdenum ABC transporter permease [Gemmatimonadetes bacterium]|nr:molybdenum ABC transporter permease [Gemmatimonadota bacterium]
MNRAFRAGAIGMLATFASLVAILVGADLLYLDPATLWNEIADAETLFAIRLSLITASVTTALAMALALPAAYALSRFKIPFAGVVDTLIDLPIVLPPLLIGFSLLVVYQTTLGDLLVAGGLDLRYSVPGIVLAQFLVAAAFAIRTLKATFDSIDPRLEEVARTLGATPARAFIRVVLPLARRGMVAGAVMTWARAIGEFGPILIFCGATRWRTEVLPIAIWLDFSVGKIEAAMALAVIMLAISTLSLVAFKRLGGQGYLW